MAISTSKNHRQQSLIVSSKGLGILVYRTCIHHFTHQQIGGENCVLFQVDGLYIIVGSFKGLYPMTSDGAFVSDTSDFVNCRYFYNYKSFCIEIALVIAHPS